MIQFLEKCYSLFQKRLFVRLEIKAVIVKFCQITQFLMGGLYYDR